MNLTASRRAVEVARRVLKTEPEAFALPLGLVETGDGNQLLTLAALLLVWVQAREQCTAEAAIKLLERDYVFSAVLHAAAEREEVKS